ncbi:MAG: hypothetical protein KatS3mg028_1080 [Bacteroidia bacterium]|nr:MAG: hypothetical protein KatS3mg028_1080 [Bacteroidia bacterium]
MKNMRKLIFLLNAGALSIQIMCAQNIGINANGTPTQQQRHAGCGCERITCPTTKKACSSPAWH